MREGGERERRGRGMKDVERKKERVETKCSILRDEGKQRDIKTLKEMHN